MKCGGQLATPSILMALTPAVASSSSHLRRLDRQVP